ncbi:MAG TPA: 2-oxoglutarate dehydrogenase complex dihydrolipoyllysine-residue succinyltransferase [Thiotrichales bacterium]|nr:2-oxoglutarate dehydrogenase complex dihydrolipoyllysine-residue succinyltransferase [Thiotrichales bacterium]
MNIAVTTPMLPESVADATVVTWHKQAGEHVIKDENLVDLETDKVVLEVPAPETGVLKEILQPEGSVVTAQTPLANIQPGKAPAIKKTKAKKSESENKTEGEAKSLPAHASPSIRHQLHAEGLSEEDVTATGEKGHILKQDVEDSLKQKRSAPAGMPAPSLVTGEREERRVPMTRLRARIAERLQQVQQTAAILTTFNEVDMQAVIALRQQHKEQFEKTHGVKLGFMSFFVRATCEALKKFPEVNASIDGADIVYHGYYDMGIAVSTDRGLIVPVIKDADQLDFAGIEKSIFNYGTKAKDGSLTYEDLTGGTFTITNGGIFGSMLSTPILNPPQCAILGMHAIRERAVVENGEIVIRPIMYLALSYDSQKSRHGTSASDPDGTGVC